jgi:hypothetical protein
MRVYSPNSCLPGQFGQIYSVGQQASGVSKFPRYAYCRQSAVGGESHDARVFAKQHVAGQYNERVGALSANRGEGAGNTQDGRVQERHLSVGEPPSTWRRKQLAGIEVSQSVP